MDGFPRSKFCSKQKDETNDEEDCIYILNLQRNTKVRRNYIAISEL